MSVAIQGLVDGFRPEHVRKLLLRGAYADTDDPILTALWLFVLEDGLPAVAITSSNREDVVIHFAYASPVTVALPDWAVAADKMIQLVSEIRPVTTDLIRKILEILEVVE